MEQQIHWFSTILNETQFSINMIMNKITFVCKFLFQARSLARSFEQKFETRFYDKRTSRWISRYPPSLAEFRI